MKYLIKNALILDKKSPFYDKRVDFIVSDGKIVEISKSISTPSKCEIITGKRLVISPAFVDINAESGEPSNTEAETLASLIEAGLRGGFAYIAHQPSENTQIETKSTVSFLQSHNARSVAQIVPIGSITRKGDEKKLAEIMEMHESGAKAFSTGNLSGISMDVLSNALQYTKGFGGKLMVHPEKKELSKNGQINQGIMSITMGYKGIPQEAESIAVNEIIQISEYNETELLILNITSPDSIDKISKANKPKRIIHAATSSLHLYFNETALMGYNTNLKLNPPLRTERDVKKLRKAILDGHIDMVYSQHSPCTDEEKNIEFDLANPGAINIQSAFLACLNALGIPHIEKCIEVMSTNPAAFLGIPLPIFKANAVGSYTLIDLDDKTIFSPTINKSRSKNSPFFDTVLNGKIRGVISNNSQVFFSK